MATSRDDMENTNSPSADSKTAITSGRVVTDKIFEGDHSHKCPTYVHRTPPCQGSCPSGEDIRGWLDIVRGIEKPPAGHEHGRNTPSAARPTPTPSRR